MTKKTKTNKKKRGTRKRAIMKKVAEALHKTGIRAEDHHATIRKAFKENCGKKLDAPDLQRLRDLLGECKKGDDNEDIWSVQCGDCNAAYEEQRITSPKNCGECGTVRIICRRGLLPADLELTRKARSTGKVFVLMTCKDPQRDDGGTSVCKKTREVATQDLFQVTRCVPCQDRFKQLKRAARARTKRTAAAAKAGKK